MNIPLYGVTLIIMIFGIIFLVVGYSFSDKSSEERKKVLWIDFGWVLTILGLLFIGYNFFVRFRIANSVRLKGLKVGSKKSKSSSSGSIWSETQSPRSNSPRNLKKSPRGGSDSDSERQVLIIQRFK